MGIIILGLLVSSFITGCDTKHDALSKDLDRYVYTQRGTLPLLLTAPHGGSEPVVGIDIRKNGVKVTDVNTFELVQTTSTILETKMQKIPYVVAAQFSRKFIDANRSANKAYENEAAQPLYDWYHAQITRSIQEIKQRFPDCNPLLIDVHGQGKSCAVIFRGTCDKKTVQRLLKNAGQEALTGAQSVLGVLAQRGYRIFPCVQDIDQKEHSSFNGGFTVSSYGSNTNTGIDAIQLELGSDFRAAKNIESTAQDLACALETFHQKWQRSAHKVSLPADNYMRARIKLSLGITMLGSLSWIFYKSFIDHGRQKVSVNCLS